MKKLGIAALIAVPIVSLTIIAYGIVWRLQNPEGSPHSEPFLGPFFDGLFEGADPLEPTIGQLFYYFFTEGDPTSIDDCFAGGEVERVLAGCDIVLAHRHTTTNLGAKAHIRRAWAFEADENWQQTASAYTEAINVIDDQPDLHLWRGVVYWTFGDYPTALADFEAAIDIGSTSTEVFGNKAKMLEFLGRYEDGVDAYNNAEMKEGTTEFVLTGRAWCFYNLRNFSSALADYNAAGILNPNDGNIHFKRGLVLYALERPEQALAAYDQALQHIPQNARVASLRANLGIRQQTSEAEVFDGLTDPETAPLLAEAFADRAYEQYLYGNFKEAFQDFDHAINLAGGTIDIYGVRGHIYLLSRKFDLAERDFRASLEIDPSGIYALVGMSSLHRLTGDLNKALVHTTLVTSLYPDNAVAQGVHAHVLADLGEVTAATAAFEISLELDSFDPITFHNRARSLHIPNGNMEAALKDLLEAKALSPTEPAVHHSLGYYHFVNGNEEEAMSVWSDACVNPPPVNVREWQMQLTLAGYYSGMVDGYCDDRVIEAFRACAADRCAF